MSDQKLGIAALIFAALMAWFGWDIQAPFSYEPVGPRAFPLLLSAIIALCGAWLLFKGRAKAEPNPPGANGRIAMMVLYCFLYALAFQDLGFILTTTAMTILVGRLFGGAWIKVTVGGLVMSTLFFLLFDRALDVVLPLGILENLL
ncbi:MAG: tripartite tricarboxylate transporter TctB family protein [Burkholderiaceae bacterium]